MRISWHRWQRWRSRITGRACAAPRQRPAGATDAAPASTRVGRTSASAAPRPTATPRATSATATWATACSSKASLQPRSERDWLLDLGGRPRRPADQRYTGDIVTPGQFKGWVMWDQIPDADEPHDARRCSRASAARRADDRRRASRRRCRLSRGARCRRRSTRTARRSTRSRGGTSSRAASSTSPTPSLTFERNVRQHEPRRRHSVRRQLRPQQPRRDFRRRSTTRLTDVDAGAEYARDALLLRGGYTGSWFHNDVDVADVRQSVPRDRHPSASVARPAVAGAEQLVHRRQRPGVGQAAARSRATAYVSVGIAAGRRRSADAADHQHGGHGRRRSERTTVDGEARTTSARTSASCRGRSQILGHQRAVPHLRLRQPHAGLRHDPARRLRQRADEPAKSA